MILVKHAMDPPEDTDGTRVWVEPVGLTRDFREWCRVDGIMIGAVPPRRLWEWFQEHQDGYEYFRAVYHEELERSEHLEQLQAVALAATHADITLLHQGDDPAHNTATALHEFLSALTPVIPPDSGKE